MKVFLSLLLLLTPLHFAQGESRERFPSLVPFFEQRFWGTSLSGIRFGKTTRDEIIRKLGTPLAGSSPQTLYFETPGSKSQNNVTLGLHPNGTVRYLRYALNGKEDPLFLPWETIKNFLSPEEMKAAQKSIEEATTKKEGGREFTLTFKKRGLSLRFRHTEPPELLSLVLWKPNTRTP